MIFEVGGRTWRVQCKSGRLSSRRDVVVVHLISCRRTAEGYERRRYAQHEVDLIAVYCDELKRSFLLPVAMTAGHAAIQLRLTPPKNGQQACINLADDFDFVGAIAQLGERLHGMQEVAGSSPASSTSPADGPTAVGSNAFRDRLGYWMERVAGGQEVIVTFRGKPRVLLKPVAHPP